MKPEPIAVETICSLCGLPWENHGENPSKDKCIELLKVELTRRPISITIEKHIPQPYIGTPWPHREIWCSTDMTDTLTTHDQFTTYTN